MKAQPFLPDNVSVQAACTQSCFVSSFAELLLSLSLSGSQETEAGGHIGPTAGSGKAGFVLL